MKSLSTICHRHYLRMALVMLMSLLTTGCGVSDRSTVSESAAPVQTTTAVAGTSTSVEQTTVTVTGALGNQTVATPFPSESELEATRVAIFRNEENEIATAQAMPFATPSENEWPLPNVPTIPPQPEDIYYDCFDAQPQRFSASNCWMGSSNSNKVFLFAGRERQDVDQGIILVPQQDPDDHTIWVIATPTKEGSVTIEQVTFPLFFLKAENGVRFVFNFTTRQWLDPATVPTPVPPTALPTNTPTPSPTALPTSTPTALPTNTPLPTSTPAPVVSNAAVRPVLECVRAEANGQYTAFFGYKNDNTATVTIAIGTNNRFSPNPQARGQATQFLAGRQVSAFGVAFDGTNLVWSLKGPDGQNRTATASSAAKRCGA